MKIEPIVSDSMGVRSLCVYVITEDARILIDPSAALGPYRYGLPPKPVEIAALEHYKEVIRKYAEKSDIFIISHYHYDHYDPAENFYEGKWVLAKDPRKNINRSQFGRGTSFWKDWEGRCRMDVADSKKFEVGSTTIEFSKPVPHGNERTRLGYVVMSVIDDGSERLLHASDVQGPIVEETAEIILNFNPDIVIMDGPPTYFLGYKFSQTDLKRAIKNILRIAEEVNVLVLDHHLLRDLKYRERLKEIYDNYEILTFAEYRGEEIRMLEAHRKDL